jgi:glycerol uptake facilitator-like aquaporin
MSGQRKVAMVVAEFVGTFVLASAMMSMLVRTNFAFFTAVAAAVVYGVMYLILGSTSGSHLNPAVTIGLWTVRKVATTTAIVYIVVQMLGGLVAWKLGQYFLNQTLNKIATGGVDWRVLVAEGVGTLVFGFGLASVALKDSDSNRYAVVAALSLLAGVVIASLGANGLLNPAVGLAVRSWSWAYVVGPIVGAVVGMNLYSLFFTPSVFGGKPAKSKK